MDNYLFLIMLLRVLFVRHQLISHGIRVILVLKEVKDDDEEDAVSNLELTLCSIQTSSSIQTVRMFNDLGCDLTLTVSLSYILCCPPF